MIFVLRRYKGYRANNSKKTIIKANRAIASVNANPRIAILNNSSFKDGFLEIPKTSAPNTVPIPTPAPARPIVANPAPIYLAACNSIKHQSDAYAVELIKQPKFLVQCSKLSVKIKFN